MASWSILPETFSISRGFVVEPDAAGNDGTRQFHFRFTLRTLLLSIAVFTIPLAHRANVIDRREVARATIDRVGGYYFSTDDGSRVQAWIAWLRFGDSGKVTTVNLSGATLLEADLSKLAALAEIERLNLDCTRLPDGWIRHVSRMKNLRHLSLDKTSVTDSDLAMLPAWPRLQILELYGTEITDAGICHIGECSRIEHLALDETCISDAGISLLGAMPKLTDLYLTGTPITNRALKTIGAMRALKYLNLGRCRISDEGLEFLRGLGQLEGIALDRTDVTDAGMEHLAVLNRVENVYIEGSQVTEAGVSLIKRALPRARIE